MRLWHYKLIPFLPNSQLIAQWRELNSIFKKQDNHILINYVYEYPKEDLFIYSHLVQREMVKRNMKIKTLEYETKYFQEFTHEQWVQLANQIVDNKYNPFPNHHNDRYLRQCFYNLQEKFDRGQKDFSKKQYGDLYETVFGRLPL